MSKDVPTTTSLSCTLNSYIYKNTILAHLPFQIFFGYSY